MQVKKQSCISATSSLRLKLGCDCEHGSPEGVFAAALRQLRQRLRLVLCLENRLDQDAVLPGLPQRAASVPVELAALRNLPPRPCASHGGDVGASAEHDGKSWVEDRHRQEAILNRPLQHTGYVLIQLAAPPKLPPRPCTGDSGGFVGWMSTKVSLALRTLGQGRFYFRAWSLSLYRVLACAACLPDPFLHDDQHSLDRCSCIGSLVQLGLRSERFPASASVQGIPALGQAVQTQPIAARAGVLEARRGKCAWAGAHTYGAPRLCCILSIRHPVVLSIFSVLRSADRTPDIQHNVKAGQCMLLDI